MASQQPGSFWLCPSCGKHVPTRQPSCKCGFDRVVEKAPVLVAAPKSSSVARPLIKPQQPADVPWKAVASFFAAGILLIAVAKVFLFTPSQADQEALGSTVKMEDQREGGEPAVGAPTTPDDDRGGASDGAVDLSAAAALEASWSSPGSSGESVFDLAKSSVVGVYTEGGQGSGIVIAKGLVLTNRHVIEPATGSAWVSWNLGKRWPATVAWRHATADLAVLEVPACDLPPAVIRPDPPEVGSRVFSVGAPKGYQLTISEGVVSAYRQFPAGRVMQTTAAISPGSSGGGLFDDSGRLVGVTTFKLRDGENMNFAFLPMSYVDTAKERSAFLLEGGDCRRTASGLVEPSHLPALRVESPLALATEVFADVTNGTSCTIREVIVGTSEGPLDSPQVRVLHNVEGPIPPGLRGRIWSQTPPDAGWDKVRWRTIGAR